MPRAHLALTGESDAPMAVLNGRTRMGNPYLAEFLIRQWRGG